MALSPVPQHDQRAEAGVDGADRLRDRGEAGEAALGRPVEVGVLIGNAISAAVFGPRGEWRDRIERQDELGGAHW